MGFKSLKSFRVSGAKHECVAYGYRGGSYLFVFFSDSFDGVIDFSDDGVRGIRVAYIGFL